MVKTDKVVILIQEFEDGREIVGTTKNRGLEKEKVPWDPKFYNYFASLNIERKTYKGHHARAVHNN